MAVALVWYKLNLMIGSLPRPHTHLVVVLKIGCLQCLPVHY